MANEKGITHLWNSFRYPVIFVLLLWIVHTIDWILPTVDFSSYGVYPRDIGGLKGVLFYPLLHGDYSHLFSNSVPLLVLGFIIFSSYRKVAVSTISIIYFLSGALVWIFARPNFHIGASGLVYGFAFFVFFSGVFRRDVRSMALAMLVAFLYGGIVWGVLPIYEGVSFEGHLFGAFAGTLSAWMYRNVNRPVKKVWDEPKEPDLIVEDPFWVPAKPVEPTLDIDLQDLRDKYKDGLY